MHSSLRTAAFALLVSGCARMVIPAQGDGGTDTTAELPCESMPPLGTVRWRTSIAHDHHVRGPMAADPDGTTYFLHDTTLLGIDDPEPFLVAIDSCGVERWRSAWHHPNNRSVVAHVVRSGQRLLAGNVDLQAFDASTGVRQWTVDLVAFAAQSGLGDVSGGNSLRSVVADASGNAYVLLWSPGVVSIVRVDPAGAPSVVARIDGLSHDAEATDMVLDAQGAFDVPLTLTNTSPGPGEIHSFAIDGRPRWVARLSHLDYLDHLTVGSDFIVSGDTGTVLSTRDGSIARETGVEFAGPGATDGDDSLYMFQRPPSAGGGVIARFDRTGMARWTSPITGNLAYSYDGGPLLGRRLGFYLFEGGVALSDGGYRPQQTLVAFDLATGALQNFVYDGAGSGHALLTSAGVVVESGGDAMAISAGGELPDASGTWVTPRGGIDRRGAARGL